MRELLAADDVLVLTGVSGGLGGELLPRLLRVFPHHTIAALVRAEDASRARERVREALEYAGVPERDNERVVALRGDIALARFGLDELCWQALVERTDRAFHLAASVDFDLSLEASRRINVDSTRRMVELGRACLRAGRRFRLDYVSTSYVAGQRHGPLLESELDIGQACWNGYEQSKLEAEAVVAQAHDIPSTVYRPSQIIGASRDGRIRKFFGYYEFLRLAARARMPVLVAQAQARPDMVPIDYVCDAIAHLCQRDDAVGRTFHLTAGLHNSLSFEQVFADMFDLIEQASGERMKLPRLYHPDRLESDASAAELKRYHLSPLKILLRTYRPYVAYERDFVCGDTQELLAGAGVPLPDLRSTLAATTRFALKHRYAGARPAAVREPAIA